MTTDFKTLRLTSKPNQYLVLPAGYDAMATPHATSPVFDADPDRLAEAVKQVALAEARTELVSGDDAARRYEFVQRSAIFRFPDLVSVEVVPADEGKSALAIYSRAKVGHSDFGVNRKRIDRWLAATEVALNTGG